MLIYVGRFKQEQALKALPRSLTWNSRFAKISFEVKVFFSLLVSLEMRPREAFGTNLLARRAKAATFFMLLPL